MDGNGGGIRGIMLGALRIVAGFLFSLHGFQKIFGILGREEAVALASRFGVAGILEMVGGVAIMLGLFTRPVAFVLAGEMAVAYFWAHLPRGFWPIQNGGELAALYCFLFLFLLTAGPGRFALDNLMTRAAPGELE